ncbi:MAG: serine/threonine-protein kinase, partial [Myxococcota bacterium]
MLEPGTEVGGYTVEAQVGQGGMAVVYRVRDADGRAWALKVLTLRKGDVRERFRQEAEIQLALDHPHIVRGREVVDVDGSPGLVMEYVDGRPLDLWVMAYPHAPIVFKDRIARQVVDAVAFAHARGLVHRDLKPGNVLVADRDGPWAKVTDFGLAKHRDSAAATRTGMALGTPRYMAPEQVRDAKRVDARADVWSLGVVLYELYTGRPAFHRDALIDIFTAVVTADYVDPGVFGVPDRVRDAIRGALQVEPSTRFPDCRALAVVLGAEAFQTGGLPALGSPTVVSLPPSRQHPEGRAQTPPPSPAPAVAARALAPV